jgi:hypothetical protein
MVALVYFDEQGKPSNFTPTFIGYGSSVEPLKNEPGYDDPKCGCKTNNSKQRKNSSHKIQDGTPCICDKENYFYSFMYRILPNNSEIKLDLVTSAFLIKKFTRYDSQIIMEAHLRQRLGVLKTGWGNHSCSTVRHDDHFHVQL